MTQLWKVFGRRRSNKALAALESLRQQNRGRLLASFILCFIFANFVQKFTRTEKPELKIVLKVFILSNNPKVWNAYPEVVKIEGSLKDVFLKARDYVHQGYRLLSHPLAGSVKPNETLYKSILLDGEKKELDFNSLRLIEAAIQAVDKFPKLNKKFNEKVLEDFQLIDKSLLESAFEHFPPDYMFVQVELT